MGSGRLLHVGYGGVALAEGAIVSLETGTSTAGTMPLPVTTRIDLDGSIYQVAWENPFAVVIRRSIDRAAEVLYSEATRPMVMLHSASLFTGP